MPVPLEAGSEERAQSLHAQRRKPQQWRSDSRHGAILVNDTGGPAQLVDKEFSAARRQSHVIRHMRSSSNSHGSKPKYRRWYTSCGDAAASRLQQWGSSAEQTVRHAAEGAHFLAAFQKGEYSTRPKQKAEGRGRRARQGKAEGQGRRLKLTRRGRRSGTRNRCGCCCSEVERRVRLAGLMTVIWSADGHSSISGRFNMRCTR